MEGFFIKEQTFAFHALLISFQELIQKTELW